MAACLQFPAAVLLLVATAVSPLPAGAQTFTPVEGPSLQMHPSDARPSENSVFMSSDNHQVPGAEEMRRRLSDPVERKKLRAETRDQILSRHPDIAQALGLDEKLANSLIELLTDQRMATLDRFWSTGAQTPVRITRPGGHGAAMMDDIAIAETRDKQQIAEMLGEQRFRRYLDYVDAEMERRQVNLFDARLAPAEKLSADQKGRLAALLRMHVEQMYSRPRAWGDSLRLSPPASNAERRQLMARHRIMMTESTYRDMRDDSAAVLERLPDLLTERQLEVYRQMEAEKLASQVKHIQELRLAAGLSPELDESAGDSGAPKRIPVPGRVRLELSIVTNESEPTRFTLETESGKPTDTFAAPGGLWIQATPTVLADGSTDILFRFFEDYAGQRREMRGRLGSSSPARTDRSAPGLALGGSGTVVSGSKAYAVMINSQVSLVE